MATVTHQKRCSWGRNAACCFNNHLEVGRRKEAARQGEEGGEPPTACPTRACESDSICHQEITCNCPKG